MVQNGRRRRATEVEWSTVDYFSGQHLMLVSPMVKGPRLPSTSRTSRLPCHDLLQMTYKDWHVIVNTHDVVHSVIAQVYSARKGVNVTSMDELTM